MRSVLKIFWYMSLFAFIGVVFWSYTYLSDSIAILFNEYGYGDVFLTRSQYYYGIMAFFFLFNVLLLSLKALTRKLPVAMMKVPGKLFWNQDAEHRQKAHLIFDRFYFLQLFLFNVGMTFLHVMYWRLDAERDVYAGQFWWMPIIIVLVFLIPFSSTMVRFSRKNLDMGNLPD